VGKLYHARHNWDRRSQNLEPNNDSATEHHLAWNAFERGDRAHQCLVGSGKIGIRIEFQKQLIVEFSNGQVVVDETVPVLKPLPNQVSVAAVGWDEVWVVYGLAQDGTHWHTWTSPPSMPPGRALFAHTHDKVAIMYRGRGREARRDEPEGWYLNVPANTWIKIPPVPQELAYGLSFLEFVDDKLVLMGPEMAKLQRAAICG